MKFIFSSIFRNIILIYLLFLSTSYSDAAVDTITHTITRSGKKILHDGFLMEWGAHPAQQWDSTGNWVWDAVSTSEGPAGYLRLQNASPCSTWTISITSSVDKKTRVLHLPSDSLAKINECRFDYSEFDSLGTFTVEWLFPFETAASAKASSMYLTFSAQNNCQIHVPVMVLSYTRIKDKGKSKFTLIGQGLIILILALLYFKIQRKIRHQTLNQKNSLHQ